MDKNTMLTLARMRDKNKKIEVAEKAENLNLKTQLRDLEQNALKALSSLNKKVGNLGGKVDVIAEHLELDFVKEAVAQNYCLSKLDSHLVSYSNDTCSLYPECA
jgi:hypothetical protein